MRFAVLLCVLCASVVAQRLPVHRIAAGDLDGDGRDELITWDSQSKELVVSSAGRRLTSHKLENFPTEMKVAGRGELLIGEGLRGYNPKEGPQTDAVLRLYRPLKNWESEEIYRQATERPQFTTLEVTDLDGDRKPDVLFAYFASKYFTDLRVARRRGKGWAIQALPQIRMGTAVSALPDGRIAVGRPYGEEIGALGDAFLLEGEQRRPLPVHRGVSSVAAARGFIVAGDGWHQDYGKIARARVALLTFAAGRWDYQLIEDVPENTRITRLELADLDGDRAAEIIAQGERRNSLGGDVRVYQRTASGWRGLTAARNVQGFALGRFTGRRLQLMFTESSEVWSLDTATAAWDPQLAPEVHTYKVDPKTLLEQPAPALAVKEWLGPSARASAVGSSDRPSPAPALPALRGKVVMLDFWATWCKPCIAQFPKMREWQERYGPRGLVILGLTDYSSQTRDDIVAYLAKNPLPWTVGIDPDKRTQMDYGVSPIPHTFLIGRDGRLRLSHVGGKDLETVEKTIESLLGETL